MDFLSQLRTYSLLRQAEWDIGSNVTLSYRGNELGGECGEAQNIIKKLERERFGMRGSRASVSDLADELADIVICVDLIAGLFQLDLAYCIRGKFNATSDKYCLKTRIP